MGIFDYLKIGVGVLVGLALASLHDAWIDDPAVEREARAGYVLLSEKTALQAQLDEMERQRNAASQTIEEFRRRKLADDLIQSRAEAQAERAIHDDNKDTQDGDYRWSDDDLGWLCQHGSKAPDCSRD